jgi:DnaJ like chaperone protein
MKVKLGKWIGGTLGWAMGGPIGGLVGFSLGALWDGASLEGSLLNERPKNEYSRATRAGDFNVSLLVLAAAMMKADGKVLKSELNYVKAFLTGQFSDSQAREMLRVLRDLLDRPIEINAVCQQINTYMNQAQRLQLVHFLLAIAKADGEFHQSEIALLKQIANGLNVDRTEFNSLMAMHQLDEDRYYRILGLEKGASQDQIKKAYRTLAKKYHPDKVGDIGEEAKNAALEKFRQVQEAYDKISK